MTACRLHRLPARSGRLIILLICICKELYADELAFSQVIQVFPGLKMNLSCHGLSATLGASPLSVNFGPHGTYANVTVPGAGLSDRVRLDLSDIQRGACRSILEGLEPLSRLSRQQQGIESHVGRSAVSYVIVAIQGISVAPTGRGLQQNSEESSDLPVSLDLNLSASWTLSPACPLSAQNPVASDWRQCAY